jgi:hypothetical protein
MRATLAAFATIIGIMVTSINAFALPNLPVQPGVDNIPRCDVSTSSPLTADVKEAAIYLDNLGTGVMCGNGNPDGITNMAHIGKYI